MVSKDFLMNQKNTLDSKINPFISTCASCKRLPGFKGQSPSGFKGQSPSGFKGQSPSGFKGQSPSGFKGQSPSG